jgi:D-alanyl-D-alanine carboxypeptidase
MNPPTPGIRPARTLAAVVIAAAIMGLAGGCAPSPTAAPPTPTDSAAAGPAIDRPAAPEGELPDALRTQLQSALEETMTTYRVPGAVAGVWVPGQGSWTTAVGEADIEAGTPVTTEMTWPVRSITKSYTVTLILQLVDEGTLDLDDTIGQYVDGVTNGDAITLRQLAGMSSGNADYTSKEFETEFFKDPDRIFTLDELNSFVLGRPAQFAPGEKKVYTNADTNLLGAVVEKATGQPFDQVLSERILIPLGQEGTSYIVDAEKWAQPHPIGYAPADDGPAPQPTNMSIFGPAGSMVSTLDDGRVWAQALATGTLLKPETQTERQAGAPLDAGPPYDIYALGMGRTNGWWGHNGEGLGFTAALFHHPDTGASIVVYMNQSNAEPAGHPADQAFRRLAEILQEQ